MESLLLEGRWPRLCPARHHEAPLVQAVVVLHGLVEGSSAVDLLERDLLGNGLLYVRLGHLKLALHSVLPVDARHEWVLLNLVSSSLSGSETLVRVSV